MSIRIDSEKCISCGKCLKVCPGNLISFDENKKAEIKYKKDCWGCTACIKECDNRAIEYYLGDDIGGKGAYLYTKVDKESIEWHLINKDKEERVVKTLKNESNKY